MKSFRKELWFETQAALKESDVQEGIALINAMHITASVSSTMTSRGCTPTTKLGWKGWHRMSRFQATGTTEPVRTMPMPI